MTEQKSYLRDRILPIVKTALTWIAALIITVSIIVILIKTDLLGIAWIIYAVCGITYLIWTDYKSWKKENAT